LEKASRDSTNSTGISAIESEFELIEIELKVFPTDRPVVGAYPATLEQRQREVSVL